MIPDIALYKRIVAQPEGLRHREYRKQLAQYVTRLLAHVKEDIRERRYEIIEAELEWQDRNAEILRRLGFSEPECEMLKDKRLDSPGMRNVMRMRVRDLLKRRREKRG